MQHRVHQVLTNMAHWLERNTYLDTTTAIHVRGAGGQRGRAPSHHRTENHCRSLLYGPYLQAVGGYYNLPVVSITSFLSGGTRPGALVASGVHNEARTAAELLNEAVAGHLRAEVRNGKGTALAPALDWIRLDIFKIYMLRPISLLA